MSGADATELIDQPRALVDHFFRHEYAQMVASLTRRFGVRNWTHVEDAVQSAIQRALRSWSLAGVPPKPSAWLYRVACNQLLDGLRRDLRWSSLQHAQSEPASRLDAIAVPDRDELHDDLARMLFLCCDPMLPPESQVALALKTVCGFSVGEIARALLTNEAAIAKRITRAKELLHTSGFVPRELSSATIDERLPIVQAVIYLLFNEGYSSTQPDRVIRQDLCEEAVRLALLLAEHPLAARPRSAALVAVLLFHAARLEERLTSAGELQLLAQQDRTQWDQGLLHEAFRWFALAAQGDEASRYHAEAWIAAEHCRAASFAATNWVNIVRAYDVLMRLDPSPIHGLNRAIAIGQRDGPGAGLAELQALETTQLPTRYYLWHAIRADFALRLGDVSTARRELEQALPLTPTRAEQQLLRERLAMLEHELPTQRRDSPLP